MAHIVWTPRAIHDLESLISYISRDSIIRAKRFASRLVKKIESLATQPDSGSWLPEDDRFVYREIFQGPYRIIYRYDNETLYITTIHHGSRVLPQDELDSTGNG